RQNGCVGANPHIFSNMDGCGVHISSFFWIFVMVQCCQNHVMSQQSTIADGDAALILHSASAVEKYVFPNGQILPTVCIERRKDCKIFPNGFSCQFAEQFCDFFRRMVSIVELCSDFQGFLCQHMHTLMHVGTSHNFFSAVHNCQKFFQ